MDTIGTVSNVTSLIQQTFHLYRHVSASRNFADAAGNFATIIAFEYFRFELWLQQSGLLTADASGNPSISEDALRSSTQRQLRWTRGSIDVGRVESKVSRIFGQLQRTLTQLQSLKAKYSIDTGDHASEPETKGHIHLVREAQMAEPPALLPQGKFVDEAIQKASRSQQKLSNRVSFFKKVGFAWALADDTSDKDKIASLIKDVQYFNNALREMLPPGEQEFGDTAVNMRSLRLSDNVDELVDIGNAAQTFNNQLYSNIAMACIIKSKRVQQPPVDHSSKRAAYIELEKDKIGRIGELSQLSKGPPRHLTTYFSGRSRAPEQRVSILIEFTNFDESLTTEECDILRDRIRDLCELLLKLDRPSTMLLPLAFGSLQFRRTQFILAYHLPAFADAHRNVSSLYSILKPNKRSELTLKATQLWPRLEQRYLLAAVLAEGLLNILNVGWVHKALNSTNIVLFHEAGSVQVVDFSRPQMMGFGLARPEQPGALTIDTRGIDSTWRLWQHPELQQGLHRRHERRFDIYSLGMILLEIGMWQDLHYFSGPSDSAFDFYQRIENLCHSQLAHHMGEVYKDAVLMCISQNDFWLEDGSKETSDTVLEAFSWKVVRPLKMLSASRNQEKSEDSR